MTPVPDGVFRALADPTRRAILRELRAGERTAGELAALFPLARSTLSGHFAALRAADLVIAEKRGASVLYRLNTTVFQDALAQVMSLLGERPEARFTEVRGDPEAH